MLQICMHKRFEIDYLKEEAVWHCLFKCLSGYVILIVRMMILLCRCNNDGNISSSYRFFFPDLVFPHS